MGTNVYGVFSQFWLLLGSLLGGIMLGYAAAGSPRWRSPARARRFFAPSEPEAASPLSPPPDIDWKAAIDSLTVGVVIFNEKREVLACNKPYQEMYGFAPEQVEPGTHLSALILHRLELGLMVSVDPRRYADKRLAGPVAAEDSIQEYSDGRRIAFSLRPLPDGGGIATHEDVTEREALNRRFQEQHTIMEAQQEAIWLRNAQFDAALNHMSQAMCFFDKAQRLIASNKRFAEMAGLSPEALFSGITLWELINLRHQAGTLPPVSPDEYYARLCGVIARNKPSDTVVELANGQVWEIHQRPMPDGGWVATHEDITERERLQAQLKNQYEIVKEQQEQLRLRNLQFDLAINNMSQGLCFFDTDQRLAVCNSRYSEMYNLDPKLIQPGITLGEIVDLRYAANSGPVMSKDDYNSWRANVAVSDDPSDSIVELQDGRIFVIHHRPIGDGGWVATHDDITERQRLHSELKTQYEIVKGQQEQLRLRNVQFDAAINNMTQGLCFFDKNQRLIVCNNRYVEMYDLAPEAVYPGVTLREIIDLRYAANSAPAMSSEDYYIWRNSVAVSREPSDSVIELANGRIFATHYRPMADGGWVATHEDITEQQRLHTQIKDHYEIVKKQQEQLRLRNLQFDAAVNNMTQGLCFFDKEQRLIVCNSRYIEMYDLQPESVYPGVTLREIIKLRHEANTGPAISSDEYYARRNEVAISNKPSDHIIELANGRSYVIHHRPMPEGGWVATHEDISEQQQLHAQLKQQYEIMKQQQQQLQLRNLQFDAAINNMTQGLCFFDKDKRLIVCNSRYIEMYGLKPETVYPGVSLREIAHMRHEAGTAPVMSREEYAAYVDDMATSNEPRDTIVELADGRVFVIHHRPMEGGASVATHEDITEQRRFEDKIAYMAQHDILTGLANRALLTERMEQALARAKRGEIVALHLVDLDHFKRVNDTLGHPVGDLLLQAVGERLRSITRTTDTLARLGGDEFAVLQVAMVESNDATLLAQRIIEILSAPYQLDGHEAVIGATVGIALGGVDGFNPDQLVRKADMALYRAKSAGRGAFRLFEQEMDAEMQSRRALEQELREALPARQFELRFQPMISAHDESISGFEASVYWNHPREGSLPPENFLPVIEEIGLAGGLGEWALREACFAAISWPAPLRVAVNLSYIQFRNPGLPLVVVGALAASGLAPDRLELEVPEAAMLNGGETTLPTLQRLHDLGVRVVMDDFGLSPSTVSTLRDFQFHKIKIGRSLVNDIVAQEDAASIVRAVATLARGFGMVSVADGIQTPEQRERAFAEGCGEIQGALFGEPLRAAELSAFLSSRRLAKERSTPSAA